MTTNRIGSYEVLELLGHGGMGAVYRGRDPRFDRSVAIKVLHEHFRLDSGVVERFKSEAVIQAKLKHPHIVSVLDFVADDRHLAIVMEHVEGQPLDELIRDRGPLTVARAVPLMVQVLRAIGLAHRQGVVHRDIKPSNILVERVDGEDHAKVTDFGIAKILGAEKLRTATGAKMGTLSYMSPEHVQSPKSVDARSDVYSLGVVLFEALTGRVPFDADSEYELMRAIVERPVEQSLGTNGAVPARLRAVLSRAMAKAPGARYGSCEEMAEALRGAHPVAAQAERPPKPAVATQSPAPPAPFSLAAPLSQPQASLEPSSVPGHSLRSWVAFAVVVAAVAVALAAVVAG
ncbi:MAG: serine/threonine protein kinase [Vicinamibacteria bacterium]|nr:serine/threonine protein kinase [Vicinamibacteria bacterium]